MLNNENNTQTTLHKRMLACLFGVPNINGILSKYFGLKYCLANTICMDVRYIDCMILRTRVMFALRAPRRHIGVTTLALTENDQ